MDHYGRVFATKTALCKENHLNYSTFCSLMKEKGCSSEIAASIMEQKKRKQKEYKAAGSTALVIKEEDEFTVKSRYPSLEYRRYLEWQINALRQMRMNATDGRSLTALTTAIKTIKEVKDNMAMNWLQAIDAQILQEEIPLPESSKIWARNRLKHPDGLIMDILEFNEIYHVSEYGKKKRQNGKGAGKAELWVKEPQKETEEKKDILTLAGKRSTMLV